MNTFQLSVLIVLSIFASKANSQENKLNIAIFYESLCPDSLAFIKNQLTPAWNDIAPYVDLKLIPFGKSKSFSNGTQFICQHGPEECKGNRVQSCVLTQIPDQGLQVNYVDCFMKLFRVTRGQNPDEYGQKCAQDLSLNFNEIYQECYLKPQGTQLQLLAEQETREFSPRFIPTIIYNGKFVQQLQDASLDDFKGVVCDLLKRNNQQACNNLSVISI